MKRTERIELIRNLWEAIRTPASSKKPRSWSNASTLMEAAKEFGQPFTIEDLIVAAWKRDNKSFGLKGYSELYPDSNGVKSVLYGKKGLLAKGWLVRNSDGLLLWNPRYDGHENNGADT